MDNNNSNISNIVYQFCNGTFSTKLYLLIIKKMPNIVSKNRVQRIKSINVSIVLKFYHLK